MRSRVGGTACAHIATACCPDLAKSGGSCWSWRYNEGRWKDHISLGHITARHRRGSLLSIPMRWTLSREVTRHPLRVVYRRDLGQVGSPVNLASKFRASSTIVLRPPRRVRGPRRSKLFSTCATTANNEGTESLPTTHYKGPRSLPCSGLQLPRHGRARATRARDPTHVEQDLVRRKGPLGASGARVSSLSSRVSPGPHWSRPSWTELDSVVQAQSCPRNFANLQGGTTPCC